MLKSGTLLGPTLSSEDLKAAMALQEKTILDALAPYEPLSAALAWFNTLRAIEECINLVTVKWEDGTFERTLMSLPVPINGAQPSTVREVYARLAKRFDNHFARRFSLLVAQLSAMVITFTDHGVRNVAAPYSTIGQMIPHLQSRRRHFVALLHLIPSACKGKTVVEPIYTMSNFLPQVELYGVPMMAAQNALLLKMARARLDLPEIGPGTLQVLDPMSLEPERARIVDMPFNDMTVSSLKAKEPQPVDRLFSAAELRNQILAIEDAYSEFSLEDTGFPVAANLVRRLSIQFIDRDYWILITPADYDVLCTELNISANLRSVFACHQSGYKNCLSTYAPLVLVGGVYRSTVSLLGRFIYHWRAQCLERRRRFRIRAGFIFENVVAQKLAAQGFTKLAVTRIERQEFDVVTMRNGVIWNVQCKNNFVALDSVDSDADKFARFNQKLVKSYERAIKKEENRVHLLKKQFQVDVVKHMVVSGFPVVTDNPRIIPFSLIGEFKQRADRLLHE